MDVSWRWKLHILLIVTCPILGCDVGRFGAQCQNNYRCYNDSIYATDSNENESKCNEGSRHGMNALGRFPFDVGCTGYEERLSLGEMDFTNNFNTCPANETVGNLPCDDIISGSTGTTPIERDLGYTFVLDVLGACFNVTVIEVNGEMIDYGKMIKKLKFNVTLKETNHSKLDESYNRDTMIVVFPSEFVAQISENNTRLFNVTAVTHNGFCDWVGKWRKKAQDFTLDQHDILGKNIIPYVKLATWLQNLTVVVIGILWWNICSLMLWLIRIYLQLHQQRRRVAFYYPPAPAG